MKGRKKVTNSNIKNVQQEEPTEEHVTKKKPRLLCDIPIPEISTVAGALYVCGQGDMGQLGLGEDQMERKRPTQNGAVKNVVDICAGGMHSLCLTKDGEVYSFGCNDEGALGRDTSEEGSEFIPKKLDLPGKCVKISAGDSHSACLLEDGRVFACGSFRDSHGNMGLTLDGNKRLPVEILPGIKSCDIASGADHLVILTCNGKVYTIGCGEQGQLGRVTLRSASGDSRRGKSDLLTPGFVSIKLGKLIEKIWATNYCSFAKEFNGPKIFAFGLNNYNQLGMKKENEVEMRPRITDLENVEAIVGGQQHTLILTKDNKCYAIGKKDYGRLGLGNINDDIEKFEEIKTLTGKNIIDISCGDSQSFAVTNDGKLYAFGMGSSYQLGTGNEDDELEPVLISSKAIQDKKFLKASSGGQHSLFLIAEDSNLNHKTTTDKKVPMEVDKVLTSQKNNEKIKETANNSNDNISDKENKIQENVAQKQNNNKTNNLNDEEKETETEEENNEDNNQEKDPTKSPTITTITKKTVASKSKTTTTVAAGGAKRGRKRKH